MGKIGGWTHQLKSIIQLHTRRTIFVTIPWISNVVFLIDIVHLWRHVWQNEMWIICTSIPDPFGSIKKKSDLVGGLLGHFQTYSSFALVCGWVGKTWSIFRYGLWFLFLFFTEKKKPNQANQSSSQHFTAASHISHLCFIRFNGWIRGLSHLWICYIGLDNGGTKCR